MQSIKNSNWAKIAITGNELGIYFITLANNNDPLIDSGNEKFDNWSSKIIEKINDPTIEIDVPLIFQGTDFQKSVWNEIANIALGSTVTYKYIADKIGNPKAVRAVGSAVGSNPFPVLVPCHRVIGTNNNWKKFGWGTEIKKQLLLLEGVEFN